jgi:small subunit ribosomal protein S3Ae
MAKKQDAQLKVRKKRWVQVLAPKIFREVVIGEVPLYEADQLKGRRMTVNMMTLTNNPKNQSIQVKIIVSEVKEGKGLTDLTGFETMPGSLKRIVRRGRTKIEDSFVVKTADNKLVRIKPLLVTNSLAARGVTAAVRRVVRNNVVRLAQKLSYEKLVEEIISFKLQKHLQSVVSKVAPIRNSEIKAMLLVERPGVRPIVAGKDTDLPVKDEEENYDQEEAEVLQADDPNIKEPEA